MSNENSKDFYLRYYVGHKGKFGHEFLEFEFRPDGKMRYANNSQYKNDTLIRKEACVSKIVLDELKRIIDDSEIMQASFFDFLLEIQGFSNFFKNNFCFLKIHQKIFDFLLLICFVENFMKF